MARSFVWRRQWRDYTTGADGFEADPNGAWNRYWLNLATLTSGQTLTRLVVDAQWHRDSSIAGDWESTWSMPIVLGVYVNADPNTPPGLNPWVDYANQSWMWWEAQSVQDQVKKPWSDDYTELVRFHWDSNAQRKAKSTDTAVWLVWAYKYVQSYPTTGWEISQISASVGVLLP